MKAARIYRWASRGYRAYQRGRRGMRFPQWAGRRYGKSGRWRRDRFDIDWYWRRPSQGWEYHRPDRRYRRRYGYRERPRYKRGYERRRPGRYERRSSKRYERRGSRRYERRRPERNERRCRSRSGYGRREDFTKAFEKMRQGFQSMRRLFDLFQEILGNDSERNLVSEPDPLPRD
mgnify:CR=1 FL=1